MCRNRLLQFCSPRFLISLGLLAACSLMAPAAVAQPTCGECDGRVTDLTLLYGGAIANATIRVEQRDDGSVVFQGVVQPDDLFSFSGVDTRGTLGTEIRIFVNGQLVDIIHTSCSQPIGPGLTFGDFTVVEGDSRNGGPLCPITVAVEIDIKPGTDPNAINPFVPGMIPVAILGSASFDVLDVDPATLAFGPDGAALAHPRGPHFDDVDGDTFTDLVAHFRTPETGIAIGDEEACLTWENDDPTAFEACDDIKTVPACGIGFELALLLPPLMWLRRRRRH